MAVHIEHDKVNRVWRVTTLADTKAEAFAKAARIEEIDGDSFKPQPVAEQIALADGHTTDGGGIIPHAIAEAMLRDGVPPDDDEGEQIPGFRCANGACVGD